MLFRAIWTVLLILPSLALSAPPLGQTLRHPRGSLCFLQAIQSLTAPNPTHLERTAEVEIPAHLVWHLLTTEDGTLAPLVIHYGESWFLKESWFQKLFPNRKPREVLWDSLPQKQQLEVLNESTKFHSFVDSRKIIGIKIRPGRHPLSEFLLDVEFGSQKDPGNIASIELHLRQKKPASAVAHQARKSAQLLGREHQHLHVHIPIPLNRAALMANPVLETIKHAEFYRRVDVFSEMVTVLETEVTLRPNATDFPLLNHDSFTLVLEEFYKTAKNPSQPLRLTIKASVGIRGETFYDQLDLWGLEYRAIHPHLSDDVVTAILDGIERTATLSEFGFPKNLIRNWLYKQPLKGTARNNLLFEKDNLTLISNLLMPPQSHDNEPPRHFNHDNQSSDLLKLYAYKQKKQFSEVQLEAQKKYNIPTLKMILHRSPQLKFLIHDWDSDPITFQNQTLQSQIRMARVNALRKLIREDSPQIVIREFLLDSGLYEAFAKSLGIRTETLTP